MESHALSEPKLKKFGQKFTQLRKRLRQQALKAAKEDDEDPLDLDANDFSKLEKRMHQGYFRAEKAAGMPIDEVPIMSRKISRKRSALCAQQKINIVHQAIVQCLPFKDIAKEHRISVNVINKLVGKARKKPKFIAEINAKEDLKEAKAAAIAEVANRLNEEDTFIGSCEQVTGLVNSESSLRVKNYESYFANCKKN